MCRSWSRISTLSIPSPISKNRRFLHGHSTDSSQIGHFTTIDKELGEAINIDLKKRDAENKRHEQLPGVIAGGQDRSGFVPPTVPDPATNIDPDTNKAV